MIWIGRRLVRGRPAPNRINVDELAWAALPAEQKTALLHAVGCDAFGKAPKDYSAGEYTVAYGYRSGKRLAMLTEGGTAFE